MNLAIVLSGAVLAAGGLALCFFGVLNRRLFFGLQSFLWTALGGVLIACMVLQNLSAFGTGNFVYPSGTAGVILTCILGAALAAGILSAVWPHVGGALGGFFLTAHLLLLVLIRFWEGSSSTLPLLIVLFGGLLVGVLSAWKPNALLWALAPLSGALLTVFGAVCFMQHCPAWMLGTAFRQMCRGDYSMYYLIAFAVLAVAGLIVQLVLSARRRKAAAAGEPAAEPAYAAPAAEPQPAEAASAAPEAVPAPAQTAAPAQPAPAQPAAPAAPQAWFCTACGTRNTGRFCTSCGKPKE